MVIQTELREFLDFKKTSVKSKAKIQDIERYLLRFITSSKKPLNKFTEQDIIKFLNSLNYSIPTINSIKWYIKSFVKFTFSDWSSRFKNLDKILRTQSPGETFSPDEMLSVEEVEKIINAENNLLWQNYWRVLFFGGFRPSEAAGLKWEQVFFEEEGVIIKLKTTKTNKNFLKSLPKEAEHNLKELKRQSNSEYLFPSVMTGKPITARAICHRLKRVSNKALGKVVVPYQLRHSIATILYGDETKKDNIVAQQLGHTKNMRDKYLKLNGEQIKQKARSLWGKPLSPQEKNEIKELRKELNEFKKITLELLQAPEGERAKEIIKMIQEEV